MKKHEVFKFPTCRDCTYIKRVRVTEVKILKDMTCPDCGTKNLDGAHSWLGSMPTTGKPAVKALHPIKDEAQKRLNKAWTEKDDGKRMTAQGIITAKHVLKAYKKVNPNWEESKANKQAINSFNHLIECLEAQDVTDLNSVTTQQLKNCVNIMLAKKKRGGGNYDLNTAHQTVRRGRKFIVDCDEISIYTKAELKAFATENIKSSKNKVNYTPSDMTFIFEALKKTEPWFQVYYRIAYQTGMRRAHLIRLKWSEIKVTSEGVHFETCPDKANDTKILYLDIDNDLMQILNDWKVKVHARFPDTDLIFPSDEKPGQPMSCTGSTVGNKVKQLIAITGFKKLNMHVMRHVYITERAGESVDIRTIMHTVGHSSIAQTQEYINDSGIDALARMRANKNK